MDRVARSAYYQRHLTGLTPLQRHQQLVSHALQQQQQQPGGFAGLHATETDYDALCKHHRFLRAPEDEAQPDANSWGARLARRYYARLFKEYTIADLSRYKEAKIGLRWRTQAEVVSGKGQFSCGAKGCNSAEGLCCFEVNFAYQEDGQHKQTLVKLCLCEDCARQLNYKRDRDKQYKKLGSSSAFDQQEQQFLQRQKQRDKERRQEQQQQQQQQRQLEEEDEREQKRRRKKDSRRPHHDEVEEQCQQQRRQQHTPEHQQQGQQQQTAEWLLQQKGSGASAEQHQQEASGSKRRVVDGPDVQQQKQASGARRSSSSASGSSKQARAQEVDDAPLPQPVSPAAAAVGVPRAAGDDRWQLEEAGPAAVALAGGDAHGGYAGAGGERWELHDGDLDDEDIQRWLDSLFTAVP